MADINQYVSLSNGTKLDLGGKTLTIVSHIKTGGQAEVYKAKLNGAPCAFKYYSGKNLSIFTKNNIKTIINKRNEIKVGDNFLLPRSFYEDKNSYGYTMKLFDNSVYSKLSDWIGNRIDMDMETLLKVCLNASKSISMLHSCHLSYKDISDGNIVFNHRNGRVLIIDNDNISFNNKRSNIKGTKRYLAPELVSNRNCFPSSETDCFSLAVFLFNLLFLQHPLEGNFRGMNQIEYSDAEWDDLIYGNNAKFIFSEKDGYYPFIDNNNTALMFWKNIYPSCIKQCFEKTFIDGHKYPFKRTSAKKWTESFNIALSEINTCPYCKQAVFTDIKSLVARKSDVITCPHCGKRYTYPIMIIDRDKFIVLNDKKEILYDYFSGIRGIAKGKTQDYAFKVRIIKRDKRYIQFCDTNQMNLIKILSLDDNNIWQEEYIQPGISSTLYEFAGDLKISIDGVEFVIHMPRD